MTHPNPLAASPETDLHDRDELARIIGDNRWISTERGYTSEHIADAVLAAGYRRPDALLEKVMAAVDAHLDSVLDCVYLEPYGDYTLAKIRKACKAAVAAVLEADHAD